MKPPIAAAPKVARTQASVPKNRPLRPHRKPNPRSKEKPKVRARPRCPSQILPLRIGATRNHRIPQTTKNHPRRINRHRSKRHPRLDHRNRTHHYPTSLSGVDEEIISVTIAFFMISALCEVSNLSSLKVSFFVPKDIETTD